MSSQYRHHRAAMSLHSIGVILTFIFIATVTGARADTVATVAGTGALGFSGDGGPAVDATLHNPFGIATAPDGTIYFADNGNFRIRSISPAGVITTVAGNGSIGDTGDGGPATSATMTGVLSIALDPAANVLYFADIDNNRVRRVDLTTGIIAPFAGLGIFATGSGGDGGPALNAEFMLPQGVAVDGAGDVYIADTINCRIRKVDVSADIIQTVAGNGACAVAGDGGTATTASLYVPARIALDSTGNLYILELNANIIRRVDAATGIITTVAGGGATVPGFGPATDMNLGNASDLTTDASGNLYIGNFSGQIFKVDMSTGLLTVFAGAGSPGFGGDGGPAISALFQGIGGLAFTATGELIVGDADNNRVRAIAPAPVVVNPDLIITPATTQALLDAVTDVEGSVILVEMDGHTILLIPNLANVGLDVAVQGNDQLLAIDLGALASVGGNIDISGNLVLTTLDLAALTDVAGNLNIADNPNLSAVLISGVTSIGGNLSIIGSAATVISLPALTDVTGSIDVTGNNAASSIDLGSLAAVGGGVGVTGNTAATSVDLGSLGSAGGEVNVTDNTEATTVDLGSLQTAGGGVNITGNSTASSIDLSQLATAEGSVNVTGNTAATSVGLGSLVSAGGGVNVTGNTEATSVDLGSLQSAGGGVNVTGNSSATSLNLSQLATAEGDVNVTGNTAATSVSLDSLTTAGGGVDVAGNTTATSVDLGSLTSAGGGVNVTGNTEATTVDLGSLETAGGVDVTANGSGTSVDIGSLITVTGDVSVESSGTGTFVAGQADVSGNTSLTLDGYSAVTATTAAGTTDVSNATPDAVMHLQIQAATFTTPVGFTATRLDPLTLISESGTSAGGDATVDPLAAYQFAFDIPTLGREAALSFKVFLAGLDAATQQALLDGLAAGTATLATKGDAADSTYQAFPLCSGTTVPTVDGCVLVEMFDANGNPITVGTPASVRFSNVVGHFSTWAVTLVTPLGSGGGEEGEDDGEPCPTPSIDLCLDETGYVTEFTDTFTRRYGKPGVNKIRFSAQSDEGVLVVRNHGCTSAMAEINHNRVIRPKAVKRNASCFTRDVTLKDKNMLAIELRGQPGCSIEVALVTPKACISQSNDSHDNKP